MTGIAIDPNDPNHAWISYTGYNAYTPDTPGHVFEVTLRPDHAHRRRSRTAPTTSATSRSRRWSTYGNSGSLFAATDFGVLELPAGVDAVGQGGQRRAAARRRLRADDLATSGRVLLRGDARPRRVLARAAARRRPARPPAETSPSAKLKKIKPVKLGKKSKIKGRAADDAGGIDSVTLKFGDGKKKTLERWARTASSRSSTATSDAGKYKVRLMVVGAEGKTAKAKRKAKVKRKKKGK